MYHSGFFFKFQMSVAEISSIQFKVVSPEAQNRKKNWKFGFKLLI